MKCTVALFVAIVSLPVFAQQRHREPTTAASRAPANSVGMTGAAQAAREKSILDVMNGEQQVRDQAAANALTSAVAAATQPTPESTYEQMRAPSREAINAAKARA